MICEFCKYELQLTYSGGENKCRICNTRQGWQPPQEPPRKVIKKVVVNEVEIVAEFNDEPYKVIEKPKRGRSANRKV